MPDDSRAGDSRLTHSYKRIRLFSLDFDDKSVKYFNYWIVATTNAAILGSKWVWVSSVNTENYYWASEVYNKKLNVHFLWFIPSIKKQVHNKQIVIEYFLQMKAFNPCMKILELKRNFWVWEPPPEPVSVTFWITVSKLVNHIDFVQELSNQEYPGQIRCMAVWMLRNINYL